MGWWKIDPETGAPAKDARSTLSRAPEFVLLNAVPGADNDASAVYLGDAPWNVASTIPKKLAAVPGLMTTLTDEQLRELFLLRVVPPGVAGTEATLQLLQIVDEFWSDIDGCYEDDWERAARPEERRWVCEYVVKCRTNRD
jgi:hypothetical protein